MTFKAFADGASSSSIGDLTIEDKGDAVAIYGSVDITRDKAGLERLRRLKAIVDGAMAVLESEDLPDEVERVGAVEGRNPFGTEDAPNLPGGSTERPF